jgi:hypothetical protein
MSVGLLESEVTALRHAMLEVEAECSFLRWPWMGLETTEGAETLYGLSGVTRVVLGGWRCTRRAGLLRSVTP